MQPKRRDDGRYEAGDRIFDTEEAASLHLEHLAAKDSAAAQATAPLANSSSPKRSKLPIALSALAAAVAVVVWGVSYWPTYQVQQRVKAALFDPDSAKFEGITYNRTTDVGCGYVNAKNKMGGYVGTTMFIAFGHGGVEFAPREADSAASAVDRLESLNKQIAFLEKARTHCNEGEKSAAAPASAQTVPGVTQEDIQRALEDGRKQAGKKAEPVNWPKPPDNFSAAKAEPDRASEAPYAGPIQIYSLQLGGKPSKKISNCTFNQIADRKTLCWVGSPTVLDDGVRYGSINLPEDGMPDWAVNATHKMGQAKDGTINSISTEGKYSKAPEIVASISSRFGSATERNGALTIWSTPSVRITFVDLGEEHREVRFQTPADYVRDQKAAQKRQERDAARPKTP